MSHVHYAPYPGVEKGLGSIPWIESAGPGSVKASLFYYGAVPWRAKHLLGARIFTTQKRRNFNPKVLWTIRAPGAVRRSRSAGLASTGADPLARPIPQRATTIRPTSKFPIRDVGE